MFDLGWRDMLLAVVMLAAVIVFADLVRAELSEVRRKRSVHRVQNFGKRQKPILTSLRRRPGPAHSL